MARETTGKKQEPAKVGRIKGGRFAPGQSGNPSGRPRGSRNQTTVALEALLDGEGDQILRTVIKAAKEAKPWAVRLTVDRLVPLRRDRRVEVKIGPLGKAEDVARAVSDIIECASRGEISLEEAKAFMQLLEQQRRSIETMDISARLDLLEESAVDGVRRRMGFRTGGDD